MQAFRNRPRPLLCALLAAAASLPATAQSGSLDQIGPANHSLSNFGTLQQQVRAGRDGLLEGIEVGISQAPPGSTFVTRIRRGPGWNTSPVLWEGIGTTGQVPGGAPDEVFHLDASAAGILLAVDELFVIEFAVLTAPGQFNVLTHIPDGSYPEPFFHNGVPFPFPGPTASLFFRTWMDGTPGNRYCSTAANSASFDGAVLSVHGSTSVSAEDLLLVASRVPTDSGIFYFGQNPIQVPFGDGFRCVGGQTFRLPTVQSADYLLTYAVDYDLPQAAALVPGSTWNVQAWFRDPIAMGAGFNLSDAMELSFVP